MVRLLTPFPITRSPFSVFHSKRIEGLIAYAQAHGILPSFLRMTIAICVQNEEWDFVVREGLSRLASDERVVRKMKNIFNAIFLVLHFLPLASQFHPYFMGVKCILRG